MDTNKPIEVGDRCHYRGHKDIPVEGIVAEHANSPLTGNPRVRVVDLPSEMNDPDVGHVGGHGMCGVARLTPKALANPA